MRTGWCARLKNAGALAAPKQAGVQMITVHGAPGSRVAGGPDDTVARCKGGSGKVANGDITSLKSKRVKCWGFTADADD
jgi:hypothetical protein